MFFYLFTNQGLYSKVLSRNLNFNTYTVTQLILAITHTESTFSSPLYRVIQGVQEKLCFFTVPFNPSLALYIGCHVFAQHILMNDSVYYQ